MSDLAGTTLGSYLIEEIIGQGGMGTVYRARHGRFDYPAALKVMHDSLAMDPSFRERFLREAQTIFRLCRPTAHGNIVNVYEAECDPSAGRYYLAMELVTGGTLSSALAGQREGRQLPLALLLDLIAQAADGLAYAHARQVIHRDITPRNLLLGPRREDEQAASPYIVKISDFGLARLVAGGGRTLPSMAVMGSPAYMAPERFDGVEIDGRGDLYALGVMLYQCVVGDLPFQIISLPDAMRKHREIPPVPPRERRPDLPAALEDLILRLLAKDPDDRPATAAEVATALRRLAGTLDASLQTLPMIVAGGTAMTATTTADTPPPDEQTLIAADGSTGRAVPPRQVPLPQELVMPRIEVFRDDDVGRVLLSRGLTVPRGVLLVGRGRQSDLELPDRRVSRLHLLISWDVQDGKTVVKAAEMSEPGAAVKNHARLGDVAFAPGEDRRWDPTHWLRLAPYWLRLTLPQPAPASPVQRAPTGQSLGVSLSSRRSVLKPGEPAIVEIEVRNLSPVVQHIRLEAEGIIPDWIAALPGAGAAPRLQLNRGDVQPVALGIFVPRDPSATAGEYPVAVIASSDEGGHGRAEGVLIVTPFVDVMLDAADEHTWKRRAWWKGRYAVRLSNAGNVPARCSLTVVGAEHVAARFPGHSAPPPEPAVTPDPAPRDDEGSKSEELLTSAQTVARIESLSRLRRLRLPAFSPASLALLARNIRRLSAPPAGPPPRVELDLALREATTVPLEVLAGLRPFGTSARQRLSVQAAARPLDAARPATTGGIPAARASLEVIFTHRPLVPPALQVLLSLLLAFGGMLLFNLLTHLPAASLAIGGDVVDSGVAFDASLVGVPPATRRVSLTNNGNALLTFSATIAGDLRHDFALAVSDADRATCGPPTLSPDGVSLRGSVAANGETCIFFVHFKPHHSGESDATLSVKTNNGSHIVGLSGRGIETAAALNASKLMFPTRARAGTASATVTITNDGEAHLSVTALDAGRGPFRAKMYGCAGMAPGDTCPITVSFTPTTPGVYTATLHVSGQFALRGQRLPYTASVSLRGAGVAVGLSGGSASADVSNELNFKGNQLVGRPVSETLRVSVASAPDVRYRPGAISLSLGGPDTSDFAISPEVCSLRPAERMAFDCAARVTFTPGKLRYWERSHGKAAQPETRTAWLTLSAHGLGWSHQLLLSGTAVAPVAVLTPTAPLDYRPLVVGSKTPLTLTLLNRGSAPLIVSSITSMDPLEFNVAGVCSMLNAGQRCAVRVTFRPREPGPRRGLIYIRDNDPDPRRAYRPIVLQGIGVLIDSSVGKAQQFGIFRIIGTYTATVGMIVSGLSPLTPKLDIIGSDPRDFTLRSRHCASDASVLRCTMSIRFQAHPAQPHGGGALHADLAVALAANGWQTVYKVALSATVLVPILRVSRGDLSFGSQPIATSSPPLIVTLSNAGSFPLTVPPHAPSGNAGDFRVDGHGCFGRSIPSDRSCNISVVFAPHSAGGRRAQLLLYDNVPGAAPMTLTLSGVGQAPTSTPTPTATDTATATPTASATSLPTQMPTASATPAPTSTPLPTSTTSPQRGSPPGPSPTTIARATQHLGPTRTAQPTAISTPRPTATVMPPPSATSTSHPTPTARPRTTDTATPQHPTAVARPTKPPRPSPTHPPTATPTHIAPSPTRVLLIPNRTATARAQAAITATARAQVAATATATNCTDAKSLGLTINPSTCILDFGSVSIDTIESKRIYLTSSNEARQGVNLGRIRQPSNDMYRWFRVIPSGDCTEVYSRNPCNLTVILHVQGLPAGSRAGSREIDAILYIPLRTFRVAIVLRATY